MGKIKEGLIISIITTIIMLSVVEIAFRFINNYPIGQLTVPVMSRKPANVKSKATKLALNIRSAPEIKKLYVIDPAPIERLKTREEVKTLANFLNDFTENQDMKMYNLNYLRQVYCKEEYAYLQRNFQFYTDWVYAFEGFDSTVYPVYRYFSNTCGARANDQVCFSNFGWTGDSIALDKKEAVIRIAFVGASTTQATSWCGWAYSDYIGAWLNAWGEEKGLDCEFEVINAGRIAQKSPDILAIVKYELLPVNPDFVIYYEGKNQFELNGLLDYPAILDSSIYDPIDYGFLSKSVIAQYALRSMDHKRAQVHFHPNKLRINFPEKVNEYSPNPYNPNLPLNLPQIVQDLDSINYHLKKISSELILSSFAMMVDETKKYHSITNKTIIDYWAHDFPGVSWQSIERLNRFENKVFEAYADTNQIEFIKMDSLLTLHPDMFLDGIHLYCEGMKYKAWIMFNELIPILEERINEKKLPQKRLTKLDSHPYINEEYKRIELNCESIEAAF